MQRLRAIAARLVPVIVTSAFLVGAIAFLVDESEAQLENQIFTSPADRLRLVVPRGWRATDQPSYPGLLLWMMRTQPPGQIVLTAETFTRELYCGWPVACRMAQDTLVGKYACALRTKLEAQRLRVGPAQPGPKDNELAGLPSQWFEYDDNRRFLRQAVALTSDRVITLVLSAPNHDARAAHVRQFDQTLRSLQLLSEQEASSRAIDAGVLTYVEGGLVDATTLLTDGAVLDAGVMFETPPRTKTSPVGPCPTPVLRPSVPRPR